jgi:hypothetical protein
LAYVALEATYRGLDPEARRGDERSWSQEYLTLSPERYPHIAVVATHLPGIDVDTVFDTAIASIISAIEATARADDSTG